MKKRKKKIQLVAAAVMLTTGMLPLAALSTPAVLAAEVEILDTEALDRLEDRREDTAVLAAATAKSGSASRVIQAALSQVGYTEQANEYTQFGKWYGLSNAYWCDMFVSWCASQAGVSQNVFPKSASCTAHVGKFKEMGRFYPSQARGGSYAPQQGDLLFFYNPIRYPQGTVSGHVGLVLYTENGYVYTIEGNTLANRVDCLDRFLLDRSTSSYEPPDYVSVNFYPLNDRRILGYASPNYADRTPLTLKGFVDLGPYADQAARFTRLHEKGILKATSSHTYSPRHGMTRGEFLQTLLNLYGLSGADSQTAAYRDVPVNSPYYDTVMTARSCGIIGDPGDNNFSPGTYISGDDAQAMISRTLQYVGKPNQTFSFSRGDYPAYGEYTIRADLAVALDTLSQNAAPSAKYTATFHANNGLGSVPTAAVSVTNQVTLPNPGALHREGYTFQGWKSSADQKTYLAGKNIQLTQNTVFTAQWQASGSRINTPAGNLLDTTAVKLFQGGQYVFLVKGNQTPASIQAESSDSKLASVAMSDATDPRGVKYQITGNHVGTTEIQVTSSGQTTTLPVTVEAPKGSITLDTANYIMAPGNQYTIGALIRDNSGQTLNNTQIQEMVAQGKLKVHDSRTGSIVTLEQLANGNFQVTGKNEGSTYILYEIGGTHASVRIDVQKGAQQHGTAVRNTSYFTE